MLLLTVALLALTQVRTLPQVMAVVMGIAGGFVIVIFFAFWARAFGRAHLGQIQGVAQALTVVASAIGPLLLAQFVTLTGSYAGMFSILAFVVGAMGLGAWFVPAPPELRADTPNVEWKQSLESHSCKKRPCISGVGSRHASCLPNRRYRLRATQS